MSSPAILWAWASSSREWGREGPSPATSNWTVYDGLDVHADLNATGAVTRRYLNGPAVDQVLARYDAATGQSAWYLTDRLGSTRALAVITASAVNLLDRVDYDAFGQVTTETNAAQGDRFKFTGREYDSATGLYHYRARWYDPGTGRFLSEDPLRFAAGDSNLYRYVANAPTNFIDPTGLQAEHSPAESDANYQDHTQPSTYTEPTSPQRRPGREQTMKQTRRTPTRRATAGPSSSKPELLGRTLQASGGLVMLGTGAGAILASEGTASPLAYPLALKGVDNIQAGLRGSSTATYPDPAKPGGLAFEVAGFDLAGGCEAVEVDVLEVPVELAFRHELPGGADRFDLAIVDETKTGTQLVFITVSIPRFDSPAPVKLAASPFRFPY